MQFKIYKSIYMLHFLNWGKLFSWGKFVHLWSSISL